MFGASTEGECAIRLKRKPGEKYCFREVKGTDMGGKTCRMKFWGGGRLFRGGKVKEEGTLIKWKGGDGGLSKEGG